MEMRKGYFLSYIKIIYKKKYIDINSMFPLLIMTLAYTIKLLYKFALWGLEITQRNSMLPNLLEN